MRIKIFVKKITDGVLSGSTVKLEEQVNNFLATVRSPIVSTTATTDRVVIIVSYDEEIDYRGNEIK